MQMKQYSMRVDDGLSQILERNAENQGIKVTRYVRSLIEKGLVIDTQIQQGILAEKIDKSKSYFDLKIAELVAQNVAISRKLLRKQFKNEEIGQDEIQDVERRAKEVIARLIDGEG
jgi:hypothetical protein